MTRLDYIVTASLSFTFGILIYPIYNSLFIHKFIFVLISLLIAVSFYKRHKLFTLITISVIFILLGIIRANTSFNSYDGLSIYRDTKSPTSITGIVASEPDIRTNSMRLKLRSDRNNILVILPRYPEYSYGDELKVTGKLKTPDIFPGFNYKNYLRKDGILSVMYFPQTSLVSTNNGNNIFANILKVKKDLRESIKRTIPSPQSELIKAVSLGDKKNLSENLEEKLNISGLRHITAVSGMHIAILAMILLSASLSIGMWKHQAFYATAIIIAAYIIMIGAPPSAVRAGIMGFFIMLAEKTGRQRNSFRFLILSAFIMLLINPLLLTMDIGFQLSFLAVTGIIFFSPIIKNKLSFIKHKKTMEIVSMTLSAQIFTLPILIHNFGMVSVISPITNTLVVPVLGAFLIFNFIGMLSGIIGGIFASIISFPAYLTASYVLLIASTANIIPYSSIRVSNFHWVWLIPFYIPAIYSIIKHKQLEYFAFKYNEKDTIINNDK